MTSVTGRVTDAMSDGAEAAKDAFAETREGMGHAREAMQKAKAVGRKNAAKAYEAAEGTARSVIEYINEKPVQAALIGIGGLLLASLLFRRR
jgi:ElaB/YqjD/DUF883 family membrane-anchored ribosome-binding protein